MPQEDRHILFTYEETYRALYALCTQKSIPIPPPGQIIAVTEEEGNPDNIFVMLSNPMDNSEKQLQYKRDFLAAALMMFCRGSGIPLPKAARKSILLKNPEVVLRVQI